MRDVTDRRSTVAALCATVRTTSSIRVVKGFLLMHVHCTCVEIPYVHDAGIACAVQRVADTTPDVTFPPSTDQWST
jgi:hypothetical protein